MKGFVDNFQRKDGDPSTQDAVGATLSKRACRAIERHLNLVVGGLSTAGSKVG